MKQQSDPTDQSARTIGVKLVRGPFVRLPPHEDACRTDKELLDLCRRLGAGAPLAADLFCGAGGLSLGLEQAGFRVVLGVDSDASALETHHHHFGGLALDWDLSDEDLVETLGSLIRRAGISVVCGGPPCQPFSKAGRSLMRDLVRTGRRPKHDRRRELWQSFLQVVTLAEPEAVLLENVPDMALDRDMLICRTLVDELETMGYSVACDLVNTFEHGVPQFRQRFILVATRRGNTFRWPDPDEGPLSLRHAIGDLPRVEGGWRPEGGADGWATYGGPRMDFQRRMRDGVPEDESDRIYDHITRPVREDDAIAFSQMDSSTSYADLPEELKRYRDDIFDDKYKRLDWDQLSRTITAHIAKDGYWYIHPEQDRTLTVREAARLQTFPDRFRFAGPPSHAFRQIGNAVPPALARKLGEEMFEGLGRAGTPGASRSTRQVSEELAAWLIDELSLPDRLTPWYRPAVAALAENSPPSRGHRWLVLLGEMLLGRLTPSRELRRAWALLEKALPGPESVAGGMSTLRAVAAAFGRLARVEGVRDVASEIAAEPTILDSLEGLANLKGLSRRLVELAFRVAPGMEADPVLASAAILRVVGRYSDTLVADTRQRSNGRLATARLIGVDEDPGTGPVKGPAWLAWRGTLAQVALMELGAYVCTPSEPRCENCPLAEGCASAGTFGSGQKRLGF